MKTFDFMFVILIISQPMEVVWKLKPSTEPPKKTPSTNAATPTVQPSPHRKWNKPDAASVSKSADDDETVPLRHQV